jgi:hypothetical protein
VPPRVRYRTTYLLIRKTIVVCHARLSEDGTILCDLSYFILCEMFEPHGARGDVCAGTLALRARNICSGNRSKT